MSETFAVSLFLSLSVSVHDIIIVKVNMTLWKFSCMICAVSFVKPISQVIKLVSKHDDVSENFRSLFTQKIVQNSIKIKITQQNVFLSEIFGGGRVG